MYLKPSEVIIPKDRPRYRVDITNVEELALSIQQHGQLQPIVITRNNELVVGGRRLAACTLYNMDILARYIDEIDPVKLRELEIEENIQREDFTAAEHCIAVKELHTLKVELYGESWNLEDTANLASKDRTSIGKDIQLAALIECFPELKSCKTKSEITKAGRALTTLVNKIDLVEDFEKNIEGSSKYSAEIHHMPAEEFMQSLKDCSVDILLTDPPYGIEIDKVSIGLGSETGNVLNITGYQFDDKQIKALDLYDRIAVESARFCKSSAHAFVFCCPEFFSTVYEMFKNAGWSPHIKPLIWIKSGGGQANNPDILPISAYEMLLYARKGDSKLLQARPDWIQVNRVLPSDKKHPTEKPLTLLRSFIQRSTNPGGVLVDPCMGSGSSLVAGLHERLQVKGCDELKEAYAITSEYISRTIKELENE